MPTATSYTSKIRYLSVAKNVKVQLPGGVSNTFRPGLSDMCSDFKTTTPETTTTTGGIITTICGNGQFSSTGDGGLAVNATLKVPTSIAVDSDGNIFILDRTGYSLRKIDTNGIITTIAGNGDLSDFVAGPALSSPLPIINNIILDNTNGDIYMCGLSKVAKLTPSTDTLPVYSLSINMTNNVFPTGFPSVQFKTLAFDSNKQVFYAMSNSLDEVNLIYRIPAGGGLSSAIEFLGLSADPPLNYCLAITVDSVGKVYVLDYGAVPGGEENNLRVYRSNGTLVSQTSSIFAGENLRDSTFNITVDSSGNVYVTEPTVSLIRKVDTSGNITTVAGIGTHPPFFGDGGNAVQSNLKIPFGLAVDSKSNLFICDALNRRIRKVTPTLTTTVPGKTVYNPPWFAPAEYKELCNCKLLTPTPAASAPVETAIIYDGQ